jgi:hypothetical protein
MSARIIFRFVFDVDVQLLGDAGPLMSPFVMAAAVATAAAAVLLWAVAARAGSSHRAAVTWQVASLSRPDASAAPFMPRR